MYYHRGLGFRCNFGRKRMQKYYPKAPTGVMGFLGRVWSFLGAKFWDLTTRSRSLRVLLTPFRSPKP